MCFLVASSLPASAARIHGPSLCTRDVPSHVLGRAHVMRGSRRRVLPGATPARVRGRADALAVGRGARKGHDVQLARVPGRLAGHRRAGHRRQDCGPLLCSGAHPPPPPPPSPTLPGALLPCRACRDGTATSCGSPVRGPACMAHPARDAWSAPVRTPAKRLGSSGEAGTAVCADCGTVRAPRKLLCERVKRVLATARP